MRRSRLAAARAGHVRKRGQPRGRQRNVGSPRGPHLMVSTSMVYGCIIDVFNTENISAECAGKLPHAASCRVFAAPEQATQHIYLNLDGRGLLLLGGGIEARVILWDAWRPGLGRCFGVSFLLSRRGVLWLRGSLWLRRPYLLESCARPTIGPFLRSLRLCGVAGSFGPWCRRGLRGRRGRFRLRAT